MNFVNINVDDYWYVYIVVKLYVVNFVFFVIRIVLRDVFMENVENVVYSFVIFVLNCVYGVVYIISVIIFVGKSVIVFYVMFCVLRSFFVNIYVLVCVEKIV